MDTLISLRVFTLVAELKSFAGAAARLGMSAAMASKHVMHLEKRVGSRLLNRTSRQVSLTETGTLYVTQARLMLDSLDEVEAAVSNVAVTPRGTLRVSAPVWAASGPFAAMLADYHRSFPEVCLDLDLSGRIVDLVDEGFDLALRAITPERLDPGLVARPLTRIEFRLVATPSYLERTGRPTRASDLAGQPLLNYSGVKSGGVLTLGGGDTRETVRLRPIMQTGNETLLHLAALEGMGLAMLPTWMVQSDIEAGRLEEVVPGLIDVRPVLHAVYPSRKYLAAKVRTFIDFLAKRWAD